MVKAPFLTLRGYGDESKDYTIPGAEKKAEKTDYSYYYLPAWRGHFMDSKQKPGCDCGFFEDQYYRCMDAFGARMGRLYCDLEHRDLQECVTHEKKEKRFNKIREVRFKKWLRGEIPHLYEPIADYLNSIHGKEAAAWVKPPPKE